MAETSIAAAALRRERGLAWRLLSRPGALVAILILALGLVCAAAPELVAPHDPYAQSLARRLLEPVWGERTNPAHPLGTDHLGRDVLSRLVHGARITLLVGLLSVAGAMLVGVPAGLLAGWRGGWADGAVMRLADVQLAFPVVLLVIVAVAVVGPSLPNIVIVLAASGWPRFARIVRAGVLTLRSQDFVAAARASGTATWRILARHILPNVASAIVVYASFDLARMILLEATLSFLGLGVQPPTPTWGGMINDGRAWLHRNAWVSVLPGGSIALVILAFNLLGDALRDALDPHLEE